MSTLARSTEDTGGLALRLAPRRLVEAKDVTAVVDAALRAAVPTLADACLFDLDASGETPRRDARALDVARAQRLEVALVGGGLDRPSAEPAARFAALEQVGCVTFAFAPLSFEGARYGQLVLGRADGRPFERSALREIGELSHWTALGLSHRIAQTRANAALRAREANLSDAARDLLRLVGDIAAANARPSNDGVIARACDQLERIVRERLVPAPAPASEPDAPEPDAPDSATKPATTFAVQRFRAGTFLAVANDAAGRRIVGHAIELARFASASSALAYVHAHLLGIAAPVDAIELSAQSASGRFTCERARAAGRIGGSVVSRDREHMREIGKKGANARRARTSGDQAIASEPPPPHDEPLADTNER